MTAFYRFVVTGRVQGVGFRAATRRKAMTLGLRGWVRNRGDGAVEGLVGGGKPATLEEFRDWLRRGPPLARVEQLDWRADGVDHPEEPFRVLD